jgi:hypothetical protein
MEIIKDKFELARRIALQESLLERIKDLGYYAKQCKGEIQKNPNSEQTCLPYLKGKVQSIALEYFEIRYGNFFLNQSAQFRNAVVDEITSFVVAEIKTKPINELPQYLIAAITLALDGSLKKQIKNFNLNK